MRWLALALDDSHSTEPYLAGFKENGQERLVGAADEMLVCACDRVDFVW
jgi:hypothetical protein